MRKMSRALRKLATAFVLAASAVLLTACLTDGSGTNVTTRTIKIVCMSRKDTKPTQQQVGENNAVLEELGAPKPRCK